jgi:hypothetical protein
MFKLVARGVMYNKICSSGFSVHFEFELTIFIIDGEV